MKELVLWVLGSIGVMVVVCILLAGKFADRGY
jgi:hypothetical protein